MDRLNTLAHRAIAVIQMPKLEQEKVKYETFAGGEVPASRTKSDTADPPFWQWTMEQSSGKQSTANSDPPTKLD